MKVSEVLDKAADLIEPEGRWTQGWYGRTVNGYRASLVSEARCFCMRGAVIAAGGNGEFDEGYSNKETVLTMRHLERWMAEPPSAFNDAPGRTQGQVVSALRQAAEQAREREAEHGEADDEHDYAYSGEPQGLGCCNCTEGWRHGCCDDLCRGSNEAVDCYSARPCQLCNPDGEVNW